jgi:hypothetical protein
MNGTETIDGTPGPDVKGLWSASPWRTGPGLGFRTDGANSADG